MLKFSLTALALVATSTFAMADPNMSKPGGGNGPGGGAMERSGGDLKGGGLGDRGMGNRGPAMKGSEAGQAKSLGDRQMRSDRSEAQESHRDATDRSASSGDRKNDARSENMPNDKRNTHQYNRQAEDNNSSGKRENRADTNDRNDRARSNEARDNSRPDRGATGAGEGTEGKAGAKGSLTNISPEQKTKVRAAFSGHRVAPARDIGVDVRVGVVVPRSVHFYPLPPTIVTIAPDYSGYEYFMIDDSHVAIVDPDTLEVVDIIVIA
ncbi:DUF1236 domain-containing protein [Hyphomicrobium sp. DY-1]|uniref:DUF1236 domain-containing protein n=1 Tax=Hyphomicrobium sp. DY-1 TaxID=3075650 RepID=UPI0039C2E887